MNETRRTRILAVLSAGTLVGVLGGTGVAFADHSAAPQADDRRTAACPSVTQGQEQTTSKWYRYGHRVAV